MSEKAENVQRKALKDLQKAGELLLKPVRLLGRKHKK